MRTDTGPVRHDYSTVPYPPHGSAEWHRVRWADEDGNRRIGASTAGALFGVHEFLEPGEVAAELLAPEAPPADSDLSEAMDRGHRFEPVIAQWWADRNGYTIAKPDVLFLNGRVITSLDYMILGSEVDHHLEVKSTSHYWRGDLPDWWHWQGVAQCYATGNRQVEWAILDPQLRVHEHTQRVTEEMVVAFEQMADYWLSFIDIGIPPEGVELTARDQGKRFPRGDATLEAIELPVEAADYADAYRAAKRAERDAKGDADHWQSLLQDCLGLYEAGVLPGNDRPLVTWTTFPVERVDTARLRAEAPELAEKYLTTSTQRRFNVAKTKGAP